MPLPFITVAKPESKVQPTSVDNSFSSIPPDLLQALNDLHLSSEAPVLKAASDWCTKYGPNCLAEIAEHELISDFLSALSLAEIQKRKLRAKVIEAVIEAASEKKIEAASEKKRGTTRAASHLPDPMASYVLRQFEEWAWYNTPTSYPHHQKVNDRPGFGELNNLLVVATWGEKKTFNAGEVDSMQVDFGFGKQTDTVDETGYHTVYDFFDDDKMKDAMEDYLLVLQRKFSSHWKTVSIIRHKERGHLSLFFTDVVDWNRWKRSGVVNRDVIIQHTLGAAFNASYEFLQTALAYTPCLHSCPYPIIDWKNREEKDYYSVDKLTLEDVQGWDWPQLVEETFEQYLIRHRLRLPPSTTRNASLVPGSQPWCYTATIVADTRLLNR